MKLLRTVAAALVLSICPRAAVAQLATVTTLDAPGNVGSYVSLAIGADQRGLISYYDATAGDLKVVHCPDEACTSATLTTLDSAGDVGRHTAIAIGQDGLGIISYVDVTNASLKIAHCANVACTSASVSTLDTGAEDVFGQGTDIAIGNDGRPLIVYRANGMLRVLQCSTAACSGATGTTYPSFAGRNPAVTATAGLPLIVADQTIANDAVVLAFGRCQDAGCTGADFQVVDPPGIDPSGNPAIKYSYHASLTRGPDGRAALVHTRETGSFAVRVYYGLFRRCVDDACSAFTQPAQFGAVASLGSPHFAGADVAIGASGLPTLVAAGQPNPVGPPDPFVSPYLGVSTCSVATCEGAAADVVDGPGAGHFASVAIGANGRALVAYYASTMQDLKVAYIGGVPAADVTVQAAEGLPDPVPASGQLTYKLLPKNLGPNVAHGVVGRLVVPPGVVFKSAAGCVFDTSSRTATCPGPDLHVMTNSYQATVVVTVPPGLTGPLTATASISAATGDPDPANNVAIVTTATIPSLRIKQPPVLEGDRGLRDAGIEVELISDGGTPPASVTVDYQTASTFGQAQPGVDYLTASGTLTFTPATSATLAVPVGVVGDTTPESNETFALQLTNAQGAKPIVTLEQATTILDDDGQSGARSELTHGSSFTGTLLPAGPVSPSVLYGLEMAPRTSMEVVVDAASGDVLPLAVQLLHGNGAVLLSGQPVGTGTSVSIRFANQDAIQVLNRTVRVQSGGCAGDCGPDDVFRIRAYDTTGRIERFNNQGNQVTLLILQNPSAAAVRADMFFWDADGSLIERRGLLLAPRATSVFDTHTFAPSRAGSITVTHDAPYGVLQGKAVALEPATGLAFDTPLTYRPR